MSLLRSPLHSKVLGALWLSLAQCLSLIIKDDHLSLLGSTLHVMKTFYIHDLIGFS